jgi:type II secretory pathway component PulF
MSHASSPNTFLYIASKPGGGYRLGTVRSKDLRQASLQLRKQRLTPVRTWTLPKRLGRLAGVVPLKDQAELHMQLAQLTGRGVPLVEALEVVSQSVSDTTRVRVDQVREQVSSGAPFSLACFQAGVFDAVTTAVYSAAERTGDLAGAAKQLATTVRRQLAIRGKVATLMAYPAIVFLISALAGLFLLTYVVPKVGRTLEENLSSRGLKLPIFTRVLMSIGEALRDHWLIALASLAVLIVLSVVLREKLLALLGLCVRKTPVLRDVITTQESARFFTVMAAMTKSGIPLADALGVADQAISHPDLKSQLSTLRSRLIEGGVLRQLIDGVTALPVSTRRLLIAAERAGDLESAFDTLAGDMTDELDRKTTRLLAVLEPLLIVFMAFVIGGLLLSIMIPMLSVASQIG